MTKAFSETPGDACILDSGEPDTAVCPTCRGQGDIETPEDMDAECPDCEGSGEITEERAKSLLAAWRAEQEPQGD